MIEEQPLIPLSNPTSNEDNLEEIPLTKPPIHNANGKFCKGNKAGKGNPNNKKAQQIRSAFWACNTQKDMKEVWELVKQKAKEGDYQYVKTYLEYILGKPTQQVEVTADNSLILNQILLMDDAVEKKSVLQTILDNRKEQE